MHHLPSRLARAAALLAALPAAALSQAVPMPRKAIDPANINSAVSACRDFNQYANGGWMKTAAIPAAYSSWGSFNELADKNEAVVHTILDEAAKNRAAKPGSITRKVGDFYGSCMDSTAIERAGYAPIRPALTQINAIRTAADVKRAMGTLEARGSGAPFRFGASQDPKKSTDVIASVGQGGLGLPDRDFYLKTDDASVKQRAAYVDHLTRLLQLVGETPEQAKADADRSMALETQLATASMTRVAQRDPNAVYHKMTVAELQQLTPGFDWSAYMSQVGATGVTSVNVRQPEFLKAFDAMLASVPVESWKAYMRARLVNGSASALSSPFSNEAFRYSATLTGAKEQQPRWKRCAGATNAALGEAVGQEYVKRAFTPEAKTRALEMVNNLRDALQERINALTWMSDTTKTQALAKLNAFTRKIGYPDTWRDYSALSVSRTSYVGNLMAAGVWNRKRDFAKIGKPVDRTEWGMTPPTVNAYYNPAMNEIVFPAGILQPPFFDPNADDAVNYGGMVAVIGHETTHGFDDQGRQYDAQGNLRDWWTPADAERYKARATLVSNQFDAYTVVDSNTHVNGKLTLGENIADLGGLTLAYTALEKQLAKTGKRDPIDGFTPEQRFFLSWAQVWRGIERPEAARNQVLTDVHSPGAWRVNGPLSNMPEFAAAFGCKAGDPMVRDSSVRAQIW